MNQTKSESGINFFFVNQIKCESSFVLWIEPTLLNPANRFFFLNRIQMRIEFFFSRSNQFRINSESSFFFPDRINSESNANRFFFSKSNRIKSNKNQMRIEKCPDDSHENYENVRHSGRTILILKKFETQSQKNILWIEYIPNPNQMRIESIPNKKNRFSFGESNQFQINKYRKKTYCIVTLA
jgi:hypothetical protein